MSEIDNWRIAGWEWGEDGPPYLKVEFRSGEKQALEMEDLYDEYDVDTYDTYKDMPPLWKKLMNESCDDCAEAFGELEMYHFDSETNPCRWRPQSELEAVYEHAKIHGLTSVERYADDEDA